MELSPFTLGINDCTFEKSPATLAIGKNRYSPWAMIRGRPQHIPVEYEPYLKRMGLWEVKGLEERLLRKLLVLEFKQFK